MSEPELSGLPEGYKVIINDNGVYFRVKIAFRERQIDERTFARWRRYPRMRKWVYRVIAEHQKTAAQFGRALV